eukprot:GFYU01000255.1.p1 GENE.GFYU01000255.1~~GFYU01000255.1.p1  ORF type:complete len:205 (+),score=38.49 GFYU01000255.1:104-718(+)
MARSHSTEPSESTSTPSSATPPNVPSSDAKGVLNSNLNLGVSYGVPAAVMAAGSFATIAGYFSETMFAQTKEIATAEKQKVLNVAKESAEVAKSEASKAYVSIEQAAMKEMKVAKEEMAVEFSKAERQLMEATSNAETAFQRNLRTVLPIIRAGRYSMAGGAIAITLGGIMAANTWISSTPHLHAHLHSKSWAWPPKREDSTQR